MDVVLIGAGRYGNGLVGRKYKEKEFDANLVGVVDPKIDELKLSDTYKLGDTPTYKSIVDVPDEVVQKSITEIALIPQLIPSLFDDLAQRGSKKVILPKPVTPDQKAYQQMLSVLKQKGMQAVVASNWYYSQITTLTKNLLSKLQGQSVPNPELVEQYREEFDSIDKTFKIQKVEVEYNKQDEVLTIDPPAQELPHALQIVYSTGLTDFVGSTMTATPDFQTESRVSVNLSEVKGIEDGISINSDLQMGDRLDKRRERLVKVYLDDDDNEPDVIVDYDAQFTPDGICKKLPEIRCDIKKDGKRTEWRLPVVEDNLNVMYGRMLDYFENDSTDALTLEGYSPVAENISKAQTLWEQVVKKINK